MVTHSIQQESFYGFRGVVSPVPGRYTGDREAWIKRGSDWSNTWRSEQWNMLYQYNGGLADPRPPPPPADRRTPATFLASVRAVCDQADEDGTALVWLADVRRALEGDA